ncbi:hypothetical protein [Streptomyces sp. TRM64462]|uniref:hypothetical protein n=1 Tax=Streptomyces sp. TRM64462 TaxID=2741726 RepID=UPI0015868EBF|nr:hypothetical protein [Streptomyces sp. TRM64462]
MGNPEAYERTGENYAQKVSVSMPADRIAAVRARVGKGGFSAYVSAAVERQLERDLLEELLREKEARIGPVSPEVDEWAEDAFRRAEAKAAAERGARYEQGAEQDRGGEWHDDKAA